MEEIAVVGNSQGWEVIKNGDVHCASQEDQNEGNVQSPFHRGQSRFENINLDVCPNFPDFLDPLI